MIVSDEYIIEELEIPTRELGGDSPGVHLRYNQTDPHVIEDGVDVIAVVEISDDQYRLDYWGYACGRLLVEPEGVEELGRTHLDTDERIPNWTIDPETVDPTDLPWWIPEGTEVDPQAQCRECHNEVAVQNIVTPPKKRVDQKSLVCRDCWAEHR